MKEGILLYITGERLCSKTQLEHFIEMNGLSGIPIVVAGLAKETLNFYEAYKELGRKGVEIVECFSAGVNETGELELLKSNITLPTGIDLLKFCKPEELGLGPEVGQNSA